VEVLQHFAQYPTARAAALYDSKSALFMDDARICSPWMMYIIRAREVGLLQQQQQQRVDSACHRRQFAVSSSPSIRVAAAAVLCSRCS